MTRTILVAGTKESTGKTAIALALGVLARERDASVGYMKPKGTRLQSRVGKVLDADPLLAQELLGIEADLADLEPVVYSPTFIEEALRGREDPEEIEEVVRRRFEELSADRDLMIVEGAGTLDTGAIVELTDLDVAELVDAEVVLVVPYEVPGDTDVVLGAAERIGDRLAGVIFNAVPDAGYDALSELVAPFLEGRGISVLGVLPRDRDLAGVTVQELADSLGATVLTDAPTDAYVERFLVGAMTGERALRHFRRTRDAAVITGGDRADVQSVALEAPGVRCLVLTGGLRPSNAILGTAEKRGVPVLVVDAETLTTIERAENVIRSGRTRDERTVERMRELLSEHADVDSLIAIERDD